MLTKLALIKGPHILFAKTAGIRVRRTEPEEEVEQRAYLREYDVNLYCLTKQPERWRDALSISVTEYYELIGECLLLERRQVK